LPSPRRARGERVLDIGGGCGATTLEYARAVGPAGRVAALDMSGPMLAEGKARAEAAPVRAFGQWYIDPAPDAVSGRELSHSTAFAKLGSAPSNLKCSTIFSGFAHCVKVTSAAREHDVRDLPEQSDR
jgi:SAM-dependent methyltransferase